MIHRVRIEILEGTTTWGLVGIRYGVLERLARCTDRQGMSLLAFGLGERQLRFVAEGSIPALRNVVRGVKVGTWRAAQRHGERFRWSLAERTVLAVSELEDGIVWAHRVDAPCGHRDPLETPWTSHRDLMGYRVAPFYDATTLTGRVQLDVVHRRAGGGPISEVPRATDRATKSLSNLLRVAAATVGVPPADRRCFRLFVQLAKAQGLRTRDLSRALMLTDRRIRQLARVPDPSLGLAQRVLGDRRLRVVP